MSKHNPASSAALGTLAEALVAAWLTQQGWQILQRRWRCRWGELDLVALWSEPPPGSLSAAPQTMLRPAGPQLAFVEVKARRYSGWDAGGLLALTSRKQARLWQAAELFLMAQPALSALPCRFDVALVQGQTSAAATSPEAVLFPSPLRLRQPVEAGGYRLTLQQYLPAAFALEALEQL